MATQLLIQENTDTPIVDGPQTLYLVNLATLIQKTIESFVVEEDLQTNYPEEVSASFVPEEDTVINVPLEISSAFVPEDDLVVSTPRR